MMEFKLPELAENITTGVLLKINVKKGDTVRKDQSLFELETDKATLEVPSPVAGIVEEILVKEGATVKVGQVLLKINEGKTSTQPETKSPAPKISGTSTPTPASEPKAKESSAPKEQSTP